MQRNLLTIYLNLLDGRAFARVRVRSLAGSSSVDDARAFFRTSLPPSDRCMERTVSKQIPIAAFIPIGSRSDGGSVYGGLGTGSRGPFVARGGGRLPLGSSTVRKGPYLKTGGQPRSQPESNTTAPHCFVAMNNAPGRQSYCAFIHFFCSTIGTFTAARH